MRRRLVMFFMVVAAFGTFISVVMVIMSLMNPALNASAEIILGTMSAIFIVWGAALLFSMGDPEVRKYQFNPFRALISLFHIHKGESFWDAYTGYAPLWMRYLSLLILWGDGLLMRFGRSGMRDSTGQGEIPLVLIAGSGLIFYEVGFVFLYSQYKRLSGAERIYPPWARRFDRSAT